MELASIYLVMAELFLVMLVGYCCQRGRLFPEGTQASLTKLVVYLANPCIILSSVLTDEAMPSAGSIVRLLLLSTACYGVMFLLAWLVVRLLRIEPGQRGGYLCMMVFSNCGFVGFPVVQAIFGSGAVFYAAIINMPFYPLLYGVGVYLLLRDKSARQGDGGAQFHFRWVDLLNPNMIASLLAIAIALTGVRFPALFTDTIQTLGGLTTPLALLCIGLMFAKRPLRYILGTPSLWLVCVVRIVVMPVVLWLGLRLFLSEPVVIGTAVAIFAMPVATMVPLLCAEYGADETTAVQGVFLSTVLSLITIPILITLLT
ncbi:MAG: AEC family transporter [Oscillospiraceae bacterium]|nr:AEC family transporter [Oscillospiraceae bacterium]